MKPKELHELLVSLNACPEALLWCRRKSLAVAWRTSKRADWMLWLCGKMVDKPDWPTRQQIVLAACACARTALKHVPAGEKRPLVAIETAERWARGEANIQKVRAAAAAAYATAAADAAASNAAYAAAAAAAAAADAAADAAAADAAAAAAYATSYAASYAAAANAAAAAIPRSKALAAMAVLIRKHLKVPGGKA